MSKGKVIFLIVVLVFFGFLFFRKGEVLPTIPTGWTEYRGDKYRFGVAYPETMKVAEYDEGGGASTITFEDTEGLKGFQIFVTPYSEAQVGVERFKSDVPGGVMKEARDIFVALSSATAFYDEHPFLGELYEIWFIKNGLLYEVSTLKSLEGELNEIIKTWRFL